MCDILVAVFCYPPRGGLFSIPQMALCLSTHSIKSPMFVIITFVIIALHYHPRLHYFLSLYLHLCEPADALAQHPSLATARATEVVLSMGEVLYIPSYWFHYIVSQDASIQCNARSGKGKEGLEAIEQCGFANGAKKKMMKEQMKGRRRDGEGGMGEGGGDLSGNESGESGSGSESESGEGGHLRNGKKSKKSRKKKDRKRRASVGDRLAPKGDQWTFEN